MTEKDIREIGNDEKSIKADEIVTADEHNDNITNQTHGTIYTPDGTGRGYSCERYTSDAEEEKTKSDTANEAKSRESKTRSRRGGKTGLIALIVALCILFSSLAAFASAMITGSYFRAYYSTEDNTDTQNAPDTPITDSIIIDDTTRPGYTTEIAEPGTLMSLEQAIESVKDSVVEITTETVKSGFGGYSQYVVSGAGSGVIISSGGYVVTNNHVIEGASNIKVRLTDGSEYDATLIGTDAKTDVAVIAITPNDGEQFKNAVIGTNSSLALGQTVIAIGNPLGELGGTVTDGIISSLAREVAIDGSGYMTLLQTNAAVSPGNSGGGLFDLYGRLIGVVNAKSTGQGIEGISFAIPIDTAWDVAQQLIDKGYVSGRPSLGVTLKEVQYGLSIFGQTYSLVVVSDNNGVEGFKNEDIIIGIDSREVATLADVSEIISNYKIGDKITVRIRRDKRDYDIEVTVVEHVPEKAVSSASAYPKK